MSFKVPDYDYSSSPAPSTPDRKSTNLFFGASNPSTTPAGPPPPSSAGSFTPAGLPPPSYGGSFFGSTNIKPLSFGQSTISNPDTAASPHRFKESQNSFTSSFANSRYDATPQRGFRAPSLDEEDSHLEDDEEEELVEGAGDDYISDESNDDGSGGDDEHTHSRDVDEDEDMEVDQTSSQKTRSETSETQDHGRSLLRLKESIIQPDSRKSKPMAYRTIAAGLYSQIEIPEVNEADDIVLGTESIITKLYDEGREDMADDESLQEDLTVVSSELLSLWNGYQKQIDIHERGEYTTRIGPSMRSSGFSKANFLASLVLNAYQPQVDSRSRTRVLKPLPQSMLEWLNEHHDPYPSQLEEIASHRPTPANHRLFWETIFNNLLRGKLNAIVKLLKNGGWRYARGGREEVQSLSSQNGFTGQALKTVEGVVNAAADILTQCPGYRGDWHIRNSEWTLFRMKVSQALKDLKQFAEGKDYEMSGSVSGSYSRTAKQAQSAVPWSIYQRLTSLYGFVMGERDEIVANAQDWCEATIGLFVWWDETYQQRQRGAARFQNSQRPLGRQPDDRAYLERLRMSFDTATSENVTDLQVNTSDPVEVALASALEGDGESVIGFLRAWSGPISSALAEVGSLVGWLPRSEPQNLLKMSLDEQDLMVLGIDSSLSKDDSVKDKTLIAYAKALTHRGELQPQMHQHITNATEGWELAIAVLGRLDSPVRSEELVGEFLKGFKLDGPETVDRLWKLLNSIDMSGHAKRTAEVYANSIADSSHSYGEALWYYALAHKKSKVKDVLDLLISYSLVQSVAFPQEAELDDYLRRLMDSPRQTLADLSELDAEAAQLLHIAFTGYATLRHFYILRDEPTMVRNGGHTLPLSKIRRNEIISALLTIINSSDDNISGGLYNEDCEAVISVDFLLALLGEALVLVNDPTIRLSVSDINTLLKAIEDLQSVGPRIYSACTEFLQTVIASAPGLKGSTPADLLRKSTSNLSGSSSFSMVGSSLLASQLKQSMSSSGVLVKENIKRGWDWRDMLSAGNTAEDLLRVLRLGLAKKLANAWLADVDSIL